MITISINVTRIDKAHLKEGNNGKYLDLVLFENRNGKDTYGNDGFVTQGVTKEKREAGVKGPILGNWKRVGEDRRPSVVKRDKQPQPGRRDNEIEEEVDECPF